MRSKARRSRLGSKPGRPARLRLVILVAAIAAFFVVPAAQAAAKTIKVNMAGTGSGEVRNLIFTQAEPEPIACSYAGSFFGPGITSGVCEGEFEEGAPNESVGAIPAEGSKFGGWTITKGTAETYCDGSEEEKEFDQIFPEAFPEYAGMEGVCFINSNEAGEAELTARFVSLSVPLTVVKGGFAEGGTVISTPSGIVCGPTCEEETAEYEIGESVGLQAEAAPGYLFA
ncbi:MAG: hypothetical protein ACTHK3_04390, partial [Solirubrobacterales bacterium]